MQEDRGGYHQQGRLYNILYIATIASVHSKKDQEKLEALSGFQDVWLARKWVEVDRWVDVQLFNVEANSWEEQKWMPPKPDACLGCR